MLGGTPTSSVKRVLKVPSDEQPTGSRHAVVAEAATDVITTWQATGIDEPWLCEEFAEEITLLQHRRERDVPSPAPAVRFFDRSPLCTLALVLYLARPVPAVLAREVDRVRDEQVYERDVFLVRPLGFVTATAARRISYEDSLTFEALHQQVYREHGYRLIDVPAAAVDERADHVEAHLINGVPGFALKH